MNKPLRLRTVHFCLCLYLCFGASGVVADEHPAVATSSAKLVFATTWPIYVLAKELASGTSLLIELFKAAEFGCPHHYSLTPGDLLKLQRSSVVVAIGAGYEPYLERVRLAAPQVRIVELASGIPLLPAVDTELEPLGNPHVFASPVGLRPMVQKIGALLGELVDSQRDKIAENQANALAKLERIDTTWHKARERLASVPVIVTHDSLDYLVRDLGLSMVERLDDDEGEGTAVSHLLELKHAIRKKKVQAILVDSQHPSKAADMIARESGIPVIEVDTLAKGTAETCDLYERLSAIAERLCSALIGH